MSGGNPIRLSKADGESEGTSTIEAKAASQAVTLRSSDDSGSGVEDTITVAVAGKVESTEWRNEEWTLGDFLDKARNAPESETKGANGCLFPGRLKTSPGPRRGANVGARTLLLLDWDSVAPGWTPDALPWRSVAWETHSHRPDAPRYRAAVALDREIAPGEMGAAREGMKDMIRDAGLPKVDSSCLSSVQCVFLPERRPGVEVGTWDLRDRPVLRVADMLAAGSRHMPGDLTGRKTVRDPFEVPGVIGAFNRVYSDFNELIETFDLPYVAVGDRWKPTSSTSQPGVVELRPGVWFSNHDNDLISNTHSQSAFDIVRIHRFGGKPGITRDQSHKAMEKFARADERVKAELEAELEAEFNRLRAGIKKNPRVTSVELDGSGEAEAIRWVQAKLGMPGTKLASIMRRGEQLVAVTREGEDGYIEPREGEGHGRTQLTWLTADKLAARINLTHEFYTVTRKDVVVFVLPRGASKDAVNNPSGLFNVRDLAGVTDVPLIRPDGSLIATPGYDAASGMYYAPAFDVPPIPDRPESADVEMARSLLEYVVSEFPFKDDDARAAWFGALFTPLLRLIQPGAYKLFVIEAPAAGTGKSLLASIPKEIYGGVLRASFPTTEEELGKELATIFLETDTPIAIWDNVRGKIKSAKFESLLSESEFSGRLLGVNESVSGQNNRVWIVTANNLALGGDLARRTIRIRIDANMPQPHLRRDFHEPDLRAYVRENRGLLVAAMLTIVRAWIQAGSPPAPYPTAGDEYSRWRGAVAGLLHFAEFSGRFDSEDTRRGVASDDDNEVGPFLAELHKALGGREWTCSEAVAAMTGEFDREVIPESIEEKLPPRNGSPDRALGKWLSANVDCWADDLCVRRGKKQRSWVVKTRETEVAS